MDELFEADDIDDGVAGEPVVGELSSIGQDWGVVMQMLPAQWEAKASELGAVRRLRGFDSVATVLRVLLIHLADGCSLRETAVRASAGGLAAVSDVALLKQAARLCSLVRVDGARDGCQHGDAAGRPGAAAGAARALGRWQHGVRARRDGLDLAAALCVELAHAQLR